MKVAIIAGEEPATGALLRALETLEGICVVGLAGDPSGPAASWAMELGIPVYPVERAMASGEGTDLVLDLRAAKGTPGEAAGQERLGKNGLKLLRSLVRHLTEVRESKELLDTILNTAQEGIQLADRHGIIRYVNPAFTRITGVPPQHRIGYSAYEVSPDGALVKALETRQAVSGLRNRAKGSNAEVVSNAAPFFVNGEMAGAVVVFQDITEVLKLTEELRRSTTLIESLHQQIGQNR